MIANKRDTYLVVFYFQIGTENNLPDGLAQWNRKLRKSWTMRSGVASIITDNIATYMTYHYYTGSNNYSPELKIYQLPWSAFENFTPTQIPLIENGNSCMLQFSFSVTFFWLHLFSTVFD